MISPDAWDFTSTVSTGSMAPDADADTTMLRRSTGTASYDRFGCVLWQAMTAARSTTTARLGVFTADLPSSHRARSFRRADESGGARAPQCRVRASPARWSDPSRGAPGTTP